MNFPSYLTNKIRHSNFLSQKFLAAKCNVFREFNFCMEDLCLICGGNSDSKFVTCKDVKSWRSLYDAAVKQNNVSIISISSPDVFPCSKVRYHRQCRSTFTLKTYHTDEPSQSSPSSPNVSILTRSGASNVAKSDKKEKYSVQTNVVVKKISPTCNTRKQPK